MHVASGAENHVLAMKSRHLGQTQSGLYGEQDECVIAWVQIPLFFSK
jgi:hypothetical protein